MISAVLDASTHVRAVLSPHGASGKIVEVWTAGLFELVCAESILVEVADVLRRPRIQRRYGGPSEEEIDHYLDTIRRHAIITLGEVALPGTTADPKDDHVVACAVEGHAQYLVSADDHLLSLGTYEGIRVVSAAEFLRVFRSTLPTIGP